MTSLGKVTKFSSLEMVLTEDTLTSRYPVKLKFSSVCFIWSSLGSCVPVSATNTPPSLYEGLKTLVIYKNRSHFFRLLLFSILSLWSSNSPGISGLGKTRPTPSLHENIS